MSADASLVAAHLRAGVRNTWFAASGALAHPFISPGGFYGGGGGGGNGGTLWDWDAVFAGIACLGEGSAPYLAGSVRNFLEAARADGAVPGCLTPAGPSPTLRQAKPVLVWGALAAARHVGDWAAWRPHAAAMRATLRFWETRRDAATGLYVWHDTMESGADDLPYYAPASAHTPGWDEARDAGACAPPDLQTFLVRERRAMAAFCLAWAAQERAAGALDEAAALEAEAAAHRAAAARTAAACCEWLWHWEEAGEEAAAAGSGEAAARPRRGWFVAYDVKRRVQLRRRTYQMAWPLWAGIAPSPAAAAAALDELEAPDMMAAAGVRSTSSSDAAYSETDMIVPYSNWRGPVWINVNAVLAYTMAAAGRRDAARSLARKLLRVLADDLRNSGAWHENYLPDSGAPATAASKHFFSWNTLAATLLANIEAGTDPLAVD